LSALVLGEPRYESDVRMGPKTRPLGRIRALECSDFPSKRD